MKVSDHLTYLAEAIIDAVVQQAGATWWRATANRPICRSATGAALR